MSTRANIDEYALKVVMRSMNLNLTSERDWLVYEVVLGAKFEYRPEVCNYYVMVPEKRELLKRDTASLKKGF